MTTRTPTTVPEVVEWVTDELEVTNDQVSGLDQQVTDLDKSLAELADATVHLGHRVSALESTWEQAGDDLAQWVDEWLIPTFALTTALEGWDEHPGYRSLLRALHVAYRHMTSDKAHGFDPVAWHTQHLRATLDQVTALRQRLHEEHHTTNDAGYLRSIIRGV